VVAVPVLLFALSERTYASATGVTMTSSPPPPDGVTEMNSVRVAVLEPAVFVAVRDTVYSPGSVYVCVGCRADDALPSPKSQLQLVGPPVDVSVNETVRGA
jgi:hypothetical protein